MGPRMPLASGARMGPFEIVAPLGAGGMGEVYRARDTRLERDVAIKVLPPDVANDPVRLDRFAREARAAAALNHPNILAVHDVSSAGDVHYLVSELLEGQTLAERLQSAPGGLSVRKAIDLAQQIALGLGAAHARGIVHRDLKPANVFITSDGRAKILDFGLAKQAPASDSSIAATGTGALPQTDPGQVLGTVGYMAPEQLRGQTVDARADIFAFGAVLYEMLAGRRAFQAETAADTISAILGADPPDLVSTPEHAIPPALHRIVARCLEKDPAARFQSAADLAFALQALSTESTVTPLSESSAALGASRASIPRWRERAWAAMAVVGIGAAAWTWLPQPAPEQPASPVGEFDVQLPAEVAGAPRISLSPDGRWLLVAGGQQSWLRSMVDGRIERTGSEPSRSGGFWAPDGSAYAFVAGERLVQFRLNDRSTTVLADVGPLAFPVSGDWHTAGDIVIADITGRIVVTTAGTGSGSSRVLHEADGIQRRVAGFLPGSRAFIVVADSPVPAATGVFRGTLDSTALERIDDGRWESGVITDRTTLVVKRGATLYELRLSPAGTRVEQQTRMITSEAPSGPFGWSASKNGVLTHITVPPSRFHWFDGSGRPLGYVGSAGDWISFAMDRTGTRVVATRLTQGRARAGNLWILNTDRGVEERLTFTDAAASDPAIDLEGRRVAFVSGPVANRMTTAFTVRPGQPPEILFEDPAGVALDDWSPDGRWVVYHQRSALLGAVPSTSFVRDLQNRTEAPRGVARCEGGSLDEARVSPDGRWLAFNCNESGQFEIYVVPFPGGGDRVRVSLAGGAQPAWRGDSRELYFLSPDGVMMASAVSAAPDFKADAPRALFKTDIRPSYETEQYRVTADGRRFLLLLGEAHAALRVIVNWRERFKEP